MASVIVMALQSLVTLATLYLFKLIVDYLTAPGGDTAARQSVDHLVVLIGAALAITVIGNLLHAVLGHINTVQANLVSDQMQRIVQSKSIALDLAYYENSQFFDKLHRAQREAPARPVRIVEGLSQVARNGLTLVASFALLLTFHWAVVLAVVVASIPVMVYRLRYAEDLYALQRDRTNVDRVSRYLSQIVTTADSAKEVRVFGFGPLLIERFGELRRSVRTALRKLSFDGQRRRFVTESVAAVVGFGALGFIAYSAFRGTTTLGELVMYFGAFQVAMGAMRPTLAGLAELYENNLFLSSLYEFLDVPRTVADPLTPKPVPAPWRSGLTAQGVSFRYPGTEPLVLESVSIDIRPGEIVALVGRNGSGKTSLTKLLCRLYDPDSGQIAIDGIDLREFAADDLRRQISVIYQDFGRYHMTARENIRLGSPDLSPDDPIIVAAARWAGIHDELVQLPQGYDTMLSRMLADGEELSIGQWQKLALARAYVRRSQLIILDEPTSSLDAAAEFAFFERFREMAQGRSALIISHRFSTVRMADRVFVLEGGRVVEQGTHGSLVAARGLYAELYAKQASYYEPETLTQGDPDMSRLENVDVNAPPPRAATGP
jgi:ATP-binding cassette subfamily B protein